MCTSRKNDADPSLDVIRIAVASSDGVTIDEHFGQATGFRIYEVRDDGGYRLLETRADQTHGEGGARTPAAIALLLADVEVVLASQLGPHAVEALRSKGIKGYAVKSSIDRALTSYARRRKFLDSTIPGGGLGCSPSAGDCSGGCR